jgi:transcriptional regulator with XRE-family HTH domain
MVMAEETINDRVKQVRLKLNLSQAKFCQGIPLTNGHYAEIELGNRQVNERTVKLLAVSYGVSERFLKTGEGNMFESSPDPRLEELIRVFKELPLNFQDYVLHEIKELKKLHK